MPDPQLVAYLRKTVPQFGEAQVREKLLEEGVTEHDIEEALAIAIKRPKGRKPPLLIYGGFVLFAIGAVVVFLSLEQPKPKPAGTTGAAEGEQAEAGQPPSASQQKGPIIGHYGYMLQAPQGYASQTQFKDLGNRTEVVFLFPEKTDPTNFANEGLYGQLGILRLEVSPLRIAQGTIGMESLKGGITHTLNLRGDTYEMTETRVGGLPGYVVKISLPFPLVQAFVVGTKVMYVLTAGVDDELFRNTLMSLTEVSPHDKPGP